MIEYLTRQEVMDVLTGLQMQARIDKNVSAETVLTKAISEINGLYTIRPQLTSKWKRFSADRNFIYCGACGMKTLAYKMTKYCPNCGKNMINGRQLSEAGENK